MIDRDDTGVASRPNDCGEACGGTSGSVGPHYAELSRGVFRGWLVVAGAFAVMFLGFGSAYSFSAFVAALENEFGASRGSVSLVFSLAGFLYFGLGIVSGPLADRWGSRRLAVIGMVLTGVGLAIASTARSLTGIYLAYGLGVGLGVGASYVPAVGAVQRWFSRRRGFASGLAVSGIGVGTLVAASCLPSDSKRGMAQRVPRSRLPDCHSGGGDGPSHRERSTQPRPASRR
jgi:predicted MFS family arabinose efflux permease